MPLPTHGPVDANGPAFKTVAIVPTDGADITSYKEACLLGVWVGTGGNITGRLYNDGADVVFKNVPSGTHLHYHFRRITSTGTTAADIVGLS